MSEVEAYFDPYRKEAQKARVLEARNDRGMLSTEDPQIAKVLLSEEYIAGSQLASVGWAQLLLKLRTEEEFEGFAVAPAANVSKHCVPLLNNAMYMLHISRLLFRPTITDSAAEMCERLLRVEGRCVFINTQLRRYGP